MRARSSALYCAVVLFGLAAVAAAPIDAAGDVSFHLTDHANDRIHRAGPQRAPTAGDDSVSVATGGQATGNVLANDTGTRLAVTAHTSAGHGGLTILASGTFSYTPEKGYLGADSVTYTVTDSSGQAATAKLTMAVEADGQQLADASAVGLAAIGLGLLTLGGGLATRHARRRRSRRPE